MAAGPERLVPLLSAVQWAAGFLLEAGEKITNAAGTFTGIGLACAEGLLWSDGIRLEDKGSQFPLTLAKVIPEP